MSLNIFMDTHEFNNTKFVKSCDATFNSIKDNIKINDQIKEIIRYIDGAKYIGGTNIKTRYNEIIDISSLSTGCKTALNVILLPNRVINCVEAGNNVINYILKFKSGNIYLPVIPGVVKDFGVDANLYKNGKCNHYTTAISLLRGMLYG